MVCLILVCDTVQISVRMFLYYIACFADGREYRNGESWRSLLDPCETCTCDEGQTTCVRMDQCPRECDHGITRSGECCSDCTGELCFCDITIIYMYMACANSRNK